MHCVRIFDIVSRGLQRRCCDHGGHESDRSSAVNSLDYKGYVGIFAYDEDADVLHGRVVGLRDVITFEGRSIDELKLALADSIEDYLDFCRDRGEEPEKPLSGKFVVRLEPALHRAIA